MFLIPLPSCVLKPLVPASLPPGPAQVPADPTWMSLGSRQPSPPDPPATLSPWCSSLHKGRSTASRVPSSPGPEVLRSAERTHFSPGRRPVSTASPSPHSLTAFSITQTRHRPVGPVFRQGSRRDLKLNSPHPDSASLPNLRPPAAGNSGFPAAQTKDLGVAKTPLSLTSQMPRIFFPLRYSSCKICFKCTI